MNVYDKSHELAQLLKNSEEYQEFLLAKQAVDSDEQAKKMVKNFIAKQMEVEYAMLDGKSEDKSKTEQLQKMYDLLVLNTKARDFMQAYMRFQRIMGDIYKIIGDSVAEGLNFFGKE
jgi:cell fate (sporulation/competence/biofilm development) regulator YlbF (YheA/YmcA/DUF963 family)